jgi:hypothetical protein
MLQEYEQRFRFQEQQISVLQQNLRNAYLTHKTLASEN